jgi:hypothetical protein
MPLSRKTYVGIAEAINEIWREQIWEGAGTDQILTAVEALVKFFKSDNPRFSPERFREACFKIDNEMGGER